MQSESWIRAVIFSRFSTALSLLVITVLALAHGHANAQVLDLTVGTHQVCVLGENYALQCRTQRFYERLIPPEDTPEFVSIAAGDAHLCGLTRNGAIHCIGDNDFGQTSPGAEAQNNTYIDINSGNNHSCATLASGLELECWGGETDQLTTTFADYMASTGYIGQLENIDQVVMGRDSICWVGDFTENRASLRCWNHGRGFYQILDAGRFFTASTDSEYYCSIVDDGKLVCSRDEGWRRVFYDESLSLAEPYSKVAVSGSVICVLDARDRLDCDTSVLEQEASNSILGSNSFESRNAEMINEQVQELAGQRFTHLEPYPAYYNGGVGFCLVDTGSQLHCIGSSFETFDESGPDADWIASGPTVLTEGGPSGTASPFDISSSVYGPSLVELFWTPSVNFRDYSRVEIHRDGVFIASTQNARSFLDRKAVPGATHSYQIRAVDYEGNFSEFSDPTVAVMPGLYLPTVVETPVDQPTDCSNGTLPAPLALQILRYGPDSGELFWQRDMYDANLQVTYNLFIDDVRINTDPIFNNGSYYLLGSSRYDDRFRYSLNAVDICGNISDSSSVVSYDTADTEGS